MKQLIDEAISILKEAADADARLSFSGGRDSSVLHHLIQSNNIPIGKIYTSMGVENPNNIRVIKSVLPMYEDVVKAKPRKSYKELVWEYGFPIKNKDFSDKAYKMRQYYLKHYKRTDLFKTPMYVLTNMSYAKLQNGIEGSERLLLSSVPPRYWYLMLNFPIQNQCCTILKKEPSKKNKDRPIIGIMKSDSAARRRTIEKGGGMNGFYPLANWNKNDIEAYVKKYKDEILISESYKERNIGDTTICPSLGTGCAGCHYSNTTGHHKIVDGVKMETTKLDILSIEFPKLYKNTINMKSNTGHTYGEVVKIAEESLEFKHLIPSLIQMYPILKEIEAKIRLDGGEVPSKNFKKAIIMIIRDEIRKYKKHIRKRGLFQ